MQTLSRETFDKSKWANVCDFLTNIFYINICSIMNIFLKKDFHDSLLSQAGTISKIQFTLCSFIFFIQL